MKILKKQNGKWRLTMRTKESLSGLIFILPFLVGFFLLFLPLIFESLRYSVSNMEVTQDGYILTPAENDGLEHYLKAFTIDPDFNLQLLSSIGGMLVQIPMVLIFSFFAATLLNQKFHGRTIARSIMFLPVIISSGVVISLENSDLLVGTLDTSTELAGSDFASALNMTEFLLEYTALPVSVITFLSSAVIGLYDIIIASGIQILIFLAGLQSISPTLYEASSLEGATQWENFWKITFPMISPLILVNSVYTVVDLFTNDNNEMMTEIKRTIFTEINYGYGSAMAWIYFVCIAIIIAVVGGVISKHVFYYDER
ncbi:MAG: sugar ABC transporter permease [Agathobacter sp.]|nr:sugar ABC transporter permease [Agathobacter sp.]